MDPKRFLRVGLLAATLVTAGALPQPAPAQQPGVSEYEGAAGLGLALRRLGTTKRVLMVGAHPDDEYTPLLAHLALGEGADVAYLSLTRGEGGQNGIGPELGEALGIVRTEELLAARRADGAGQFFTRAYDFGFSKNAEEAFLHWPREELLRDVVGVIRRYRPDVVVTVFSGTPQDGHGQHQVSAIVAAEAFEAAGDPARFPEQVAAGLRPHRPASLYQSLWRGAENATLRLQVGGYDPLLGRSPYQLAMASRSRHRSQDMGRPEPAGPQWAHLRRWPVGGPAGENGGEAGASLFAGIDTTLTARAISDAARRTRADAAFSEYRVLAARLRSEANPLEPGRLVPGLASALALLDRGEAALSGDSSPAAQDLRFRIAAERADARAALARAAGVVFDATADDSRVVPGQEVTVTASVWNGGTRPVRVSALGPDLPPGWSANSQDTLPASVAPGTLAVRRFRVRVPADAAPDGAYFLRQPRAGDMYAWTGDWSVDGDPFEPAPVRGRAAVVLEGAELPLGAEATFREVDLRQGELRRPVLVVPAVSVRMSPAATVLAVSGAAASPAPLRYRVKLQAEAPGGIAGTLRLAAPSGWTVEPREVPVRFAGPGEQREVEFSVRAPAGVKTGDYPVGAVFEAEDGRRFERGVQMVDYPHVRARPLLHDAASRVRAADVQVPAGLKVAYVTGAGEEGPAVLEQLGIVPDLLDTEALAGRDLSGYDVIVAGSRAYEVRPDLAAHNARLLDYVRRGGTLIVQYNKYELVQGGFTPYPLTMGRPHDRVTDESAPVRMLDPAHPVLSWPNRIGESDFEGWIQERGLYFARTWDPKYTPLLEMADPGEAPLRGGLLVAPYGEGTYVYTGLAFFRQLPEGVPGAWRLFANLLALGADRNAPARTR